VIFANLFSLAVTASVVLIRGINLKVDKELRAPLFMRSVIGCIGLTALSFGAVLVPITVQMTIGNLAPFFASLLAFFLVGERITKFELVAMILSFGAIVLIAIARSNHVEI
jgi:drug/metabolite transporter (DMT)-like permease